jgi:hypothetical protein
MNQQSATDADLWQDLKEKETAYAAASRAFLTQAKNRAAVVRDALRSRDQYTALGVVKSLNDDEKKELFGTLVFLASSGHGTIDFVRDLILSMPRDWVLYNIEREAEPLLQEGTYDEYRRFLELYELLDPCMTRRLARRAVAHADPDIREAGEDYLVKCEPANGVST